ncbi:MAG: metallophosphoesterase [Bacteroidota bacterium]|nr:metallophosphoesterase [Bacteroidota bacterium]
MKQASAVLMFLFFALVCRAQSDTMQAKLILIGDAGDFKGGRHPVIDAVRETTKFDKKTTVLYLGDNLYTTGLPDDQYSFYDIRRSVLDTQMAIANGTDARVFFIPGNHDWDKGGKGGWDAIRRQQQYIDSKGGKNVKFYPEDGCGGPVEVALSEDVTMILFDSQWWIHPYDKPGVESDCPYKTQLEVLNQIGDILTKNSKKLVILACHHTFRSYGIHGGYFTLKQHIFPFTDAIPKMYIPLPGIGSIYPIARGVFGIPEDLSHPAYANMIRDVEKVVKGHPNVIFVAGHEHSLQLIKDSTYNYIVSGSGTKHTRVSPNKKAPFVSDLNGYAILDISKNKNVDVTFYTVSDSIRKAYNSHLLNFSKLPAPDVKDSVPVVYVPYSADSITVAANPKYARASGTKRFFNGNNYRNIWAQPVKLKVFRVNEEMGGFKVGEMGGGHQTKSLRLTDKKGKEWTLRTINKDITKILPGNVQGTLAQDYIQDFISSAHPYAPVIIPPLAKAVNVTVATPRIFYIPNDPALGIYLPYFANTICMLEERQPIAPGEDTKSEQKVVNKLIDDNDNHVDQQAFLRARLLDFLVADWDRHFDQWRFLEKDTGKGKLYYPIPRDRDQAFSYSNGFLVSLASENFIPFLKGFRKNIPKIQWLAYWARDLDRNFLNTLDSSVWRKTANNFRANLPNQVIDDAVKKLPPEIYKLDGAELAEKLKSRRDYLPGKAMKYYRFLSKQVNVVGSNKNEYFKVESVGKNLQVRVYKKTRKTDSSAIIYNRVFEPSVTKEIDLYGLNGDDIFEVDKNAKSKIKLRIIGGKGDDTFNIKGHVKSYLYDLSGEKNFIQNKSRSVIKFDNSPEVNKYSSTGFNYNRYYFPNLNLGYNAEDGLMAGIGFSRKTFAFRKEPYSTFQKLNTLYAFTSGSYKVNYLGDFNEVIGKNDLVVNAEMAKPALNNFFGIGNFTKVRNDKDVQYYRVRYNYVYGDLLLRRRLGDVLKISVGPQIYHYWNHPQDNYQKILNSPSLVGLDSLRVYQTKTYAGGKVSILLNNVNSEFMPTRGVNWNTEFSAMGGLNKNSRPLTTFTTDMTVYSSLTDPPRVVSILKLGGGHIFSKDYEYFQALNLGQNNFLRGFRKNRFAGSSLAYGSLTLLVKLLDTKSYIFPGSIGVLGFDDVGRVWAESQNSKKWHNSVGGGLYYSPFNMVLISAAVGFSEEETLFNISIGTKFNLTF